MQSPKHKDVLKHVEHALARFGDLVSRKDMAIVDEFAAGAILVGSELGEVARSANEIATFFEEFFAHPVRVHWVWDRVQASVAGDITWFFAEGTVFSEGHGQNQQVPYRLAGVLRRYDQRWVWEQFHGAESR